MTIDKDHIFIGYVPGVKTLANKPMVTDFHTRLSGAKYICEINGGRNRYFYIEERKWEIHMPLAPNKPGKLIKTYHFNRADFSDAPYANEQLTIAQNVES